MAKTITFRVVGGRAHFKCFACQKKRILSVPPGVRTRSIRCHNCQEISHCSFNRREELREQQLGKALLTTREHRQMAIDLHDISLKGVGFDIAARDMEKIMPGKEIEIKCSWNSQLFARSRYVVKTIKGRRVGAQNIKYS
ncbi:MAG: hypothetical protein ACWGOX_01935 [Desulforhopalus sp.]